jgi:hypothetical protein
MGRGRGTRGLLVEHKLCGVRWIETGVWMRSVTYFACHFLSFDIVDVSFNALSPFQLLMIQMCLSMLSKVCWKQVDIRFCFLFLYVLFSILVQRPIGSNSSAEAITIFSSANVTRSMTIIHFPATKNPRSIFPHLDKVGPH